MTGFGPTQPGEEYFKNGLWGYDGSQWRKLSLLWGYTDRYAEAEINLNCTLGTNILTFTTVPAGEVWKITALTWVNANTACSVIVAQVNDGSTDYVVFVEPAPAANVHKSIVIDLTLKAGDSLRIVFYGCAVNDDVSAWAVGSKMAVV